MELNQATKQKFIEMFKNNREKIANYKKNFQKFMKEIRERKKKEVTNNER